MKNEQYEEKILKRYVRIKSMVEKCDWLWHVTKYGKKMKKIPKPLIGIEPTTS